jgi:hypothetical protein
MKRLSQCTLPDLQLLYGYVGTGMDTDAKQARVFNYYY